MEQNIAEMAATTSAAHLKFTITLFELLLVY